MTSEVSAKLGRKMDEDIDSSAVLFPTLLVVFQREAGQQSAGSTGVGS